MKKGAVQVCGALMLLGLFVSSPKSVSAQQAQSVTLRVLTLNVWSGIDYEGVWAMGEYEDASRREQRFGILLDQIKTVQPDIICLQEVNPVPDYARRLARALNYEAYGYVAMGGIRVGPVGLPVNFREGDAILIRKGLETRSVGRKILEGQGISNNWITFHFEEITQVMGVEILLGDMPVYVFNTHLHAGRAPDGEVLAYLRERWVSQDITSGQFSDILDEFRRNQQRRIHEIQSAMDFIESGTDSTSVMLFAGDFNMLQNSSEYYLLDSAGYVDTYRLKPSGGQFTWDSERNTNIGTYYQTPPPQEEYLAHARWNVDQGSRRIDYVFIRGDTSGYQVRNTQLFGTRAADGVHLSDHFGYIADITIHYKPQRTTNE